MTDCKAIRHYVADFLKASPQTEAGDNVYPGRVRTFTRTDLPMLNVFTPEDQRDESSGYNSKHHKTRMCNLEIWAAVAPETDQELADTLDDLIGEVCGKLDADRYLGGLVTYMEWRSTTCEYNPDADIPHGIAQIIYEVKYL